MEARISFGILSRRGRLLSDLALAGALLIVAVAVVLDVATIGLSLVCCLIQRCILVDSGPSLTASLQLAAFDDFALADMAFDGAALESVDFGAADPVCFDLKDLSFGAMISFVGVSDATLRGFHVLSKRCRGNVASIKERRGYLRACG